MDAIGTRQVGKSRVDLRQHVSTAMKAKKPKAKAAGHGEELTLRIEGALVTPEDFKKAVHAFVELLVNVTADTSKGEKKPQWNMSVRQGSSVLVARAVPDLETRRAAREAVKRVKSGVAKIEKGRFDFADLPPRAIYAVRDLASLPAKINQIGITSVTIGNGTGKRLPVTSKSADFLNKNIGTQKTSIGSIEGKLSTITERGKFQFVVYDALSDRGVNCFVPADKNKEAHAAFGRRVNVFGTVQYDKDGRPLSIQVKTIRLLRDLTELPPIAFFKGILKTA